ncbi:KICSTOR complex protein ITFG2-like isoform X2 [Corticium candelabrum]|uniref:KICSTOR complex protein ITFG2-like isoform X2 n=1 Tax=Corticium candelabrum TaxID=121492 RepID=UPI002E27148E|nr:KICSTOR complex protein ITFG2-like isoform X2 [Corticium candelabrum]
MRRSVSFVDRLELQLKGNVFSQALCLGDVDNDGKSELVVGNVHGDLAVFKKGERTRPWRSCHNLGSIACVGVADLCQIGQNVLVCVSAEGYCHIFYFQEKKEFEDLVNDMKPTCTQRIPANIRVLLLDNIMSDGTCHLVVGYTDRVVRAYRWIKSESQSSSLSGSLVAVKKWNLEGQVGSLSLTDMPDGSRYLLVAQPGGNFVYLQVDYGASTDSLDDSDGQATAKSKPIPMGHRRVSSNTSELDAVFASSPHSSRPIGSSASAGISTEVLGLIKCKEEGLTRQQNLIAVSTLDGSLQLLEGSKLLWELHVDHQLFSLAKLDMTNDGNEEVIACAWDGLTYIVDRHRNVVRYQFEENVAAFCAGNYCVEAHDVPCLVYATFSGRIYVYYNITLPRIVVSSLASVIEEELEKFPRLKKKIDDEGLSRRNLVSWCLYGRQIEGKKQGEETNK